MKNHHKTLAHITQATMLTAVISVGAVACSDHHDHNHDHDDHKNHSAEKHSNTEHEKHNDSHDEHNHGAHNEHEGHDHDEKVAHIGAHVHGEATLNIVAAKNSVTLQFNTPSINVFGFEHNPKTQTQKDTVAKQLLQLKQAPDLFNIIGGNCKAVKVNLISPFANTAKKLTHSDVKATYSYTCKNSKAINSVNVQLFRLFDRIQHINVQWVNTSKQGAKQLKYTDSTVTFK